MWTSKPIIQTVINNCRQENIHFPARPASLRNNFKKHDDKWESIWPWTKKSSNRISVQRQFPVLDALVAPNRDDLRLKLAIFLSILRLRCIRIRYSRFLCAPQKTHWRVMTLRSKRSIMQHKSATVFAAFRSASFLQKGGNYEISIIENWRKLVPWNIHTAQHSNSNPSLLHQLSSFNKFLKSCSTS